NSKISLINSGVNAAPATGAAIQINDTGLYQITYKVFGLNANSAVTQVLWNFLLNGVVQTNFGLTEINLAVGTRSNNLISFTLRITQIGTKLQIQNGNAAQTVTLQDEPNHEAPAQFTILKLTN